MGFNQEPIRKKEDFLIFGSPLISSDEIDEVVATMKSGWIGTGPKVAFFEKAISAYKGSPYSIAVNSCTAALHLCILSLRLKPGDEVITTPMTFCATVNAIIHAGATPVLADINSKTLNIDPEMVEEKITDRTRAILPVHFAGHPCDMKKLVEIANKYNLAIIEDCAHAIETEYNGKKVGTFGKFGCLSFYVTKNIITGEGGMVLTSSEKDAARIKVLALHGMSKDAWKRFGDEGYKHYSVIECGFKYNMMDLQAAIGLKQLEKIEDYWKKRKAICQYYNSAFSEVPIQIPSFELESNSKHGYHLYTIQIEPRRSGISRDNFLDAMTHQNIGVGVHYLSIPEHPYYQERYGWRPEDYPHAMKVGRETVSLPLSAKLCEKDIDDVVKAVKSIIIPH